ncbi:MAG: NAD-dependent epimerase/dehydratase family protein [Pseudomonadota bacterium]
MRLLVIGASGRLGRAVRAAWPDMPGVEVTWAARSGADGTQAVDLARPGALEAAARVTGAEAIASLAGTVTARDHVTLAEEAARAAEALDLPLFLPSSAAVYGGGAALAEDAPLPDPATLAPYGSMKQAMEAAMAGRPRVTCLRIGNVAGADAILGGWRPGFELDTFPDGRTPRRAYLTAGDLARVLAGLAQAAQTRALPPVLNVARPGTEEMGALLDAAGLAWRPRPAPPGALEEVSLDTAALAGILGPERALPEATPEGLLAHLGSLRTLTS